MKFSRKTALLLWREIYGDRKIVKDFAGRTMYYYGYGDINCTITVNSRAVRAGWNIDHILPKSKGGLNDKNNLACTNIATNQEKSDKTTFWTMGKKFQVRKENGWYKNARV